MKKLLASMLVMMISIAVFGCSPDKQRGIEDVGGSKTKTKFDAHGYNLVDNNVGRDKGPAAMYYRANKERREPQLIDRLERQVRGIRGVDDVKIISYKDNLLVGVKTTGTPQPDTINLKVDSPQTPSRPQQIFNGKPDALQQRVVADIRSRLQADTRYNTLFVTTDPIMYQRINTLKHHSIHAQQVDENEYRVLLNEIGYTTKGFNLID